MCFKQRVLTGAVFTSAAFVGGVGIAAHSHGDDEIVAAPLDARLAPGDPSGDAGNLAPAAHPTPPDSPPVNAGPSDSARGLRRIDVALPPVEGGGGLGVRECITAADCDDGLFCNGPELCIAGECFRDAAPCDTGPCDEALDVCVECLADGDCDDGDLCNGIEVCVDGVCQPGGAPFLDGAQVGSVWRSDVVEASGIAVSYWNPGVIWTHNDSGGTNAVFALSTSGDMLGVYQLGAGTLWDAEDMAIGSGPRRGVDYLYIGDIGDNNSARATICVKRVPEPLVDLTQGPVSVVLGDVDIITLRYPAGAAAPDHQDSETLLVDTNGDIYIVTKRNNPNRVYRARFPQSTSAVNVLEYVAELPQGPGLSWITAGDCTRDGEWIVVTNDGGYDYANIWHRTPGTDLASAFLTAPCTLLLRSEPQGEAIGWDPLNGGFYTLSEAHHDWEPLWFYARNEPPFGD